MVNAENIVDDAHRTLLDHDHIDKMVTLRMNKKFMERARHKDAFTSIKVQYVLSVDEHVSPNEDWKY